MAGLSYFIDAFGNALGNSVAGKHRVAAEKARAEQIKSFEGVGPIFDWRDIDYSKEPVTQAFPLSAADDPSNWSWNEQDLLSSDNLV